MQTSETGVELITVVSTDAPRRTPIYKYGSDGNPFVSRTDVENIVTLFESGDAHPTGQICILSDGQQVVAGRTPRVNQLIAAGRLKIVS